MDSGAGISTANGAVDFPEYSLKDSEASRQGRHLVGAGRQRIPIQGQRTVKLRLGQPNGRTARMKFQEAGVRRAICSVGESAEAGNMAIFDQQESVVLPVGSPEIQAIREIIKKAKSKLTMTCDNNDHAVICRYH